MPAGPSAPLAAGTQICRKLALHETPYGAATTRAGFPGSAVDPRLPLVLADLAVPVAKVAQGRAAGLDGFAQHALQRGMQTRGPHRADAVAGGARVDAGLPQRI